MNELWLALIIPAYVHGKPKRVHVLYDTATDPEDATHKAKALLKGRHKDAIVIAHKGVKPVFIWTHSDFTK